MTLLPAERLNELALNHPELTQERRQFIVEFLQDGSALDHERLFQENDLPADEYAFVQACFGLTYETRPFPRLLPSERAL